MRLFIGIFSLLFASLVFADEIATPSADFHESQDDSMYYNSMYSASSHQRVREEAEEGFASYSYPHAKVEPSEDVADSYRELSAADSEALRKQKLIMHIYQDVDLTPTIKFYYKKPRIVVKTLFPALTTENLAKAENVADFNLRVSTLIQEEIVKFTDAVNDSQKTKTNLPKKMNNTLFIDYAASYIKSKKNNLLSVRFTIQGMAAGMAHPAHTVRVLNYNLTTGQEMQLADLFIENTDYVNILSEYAITAFSRTFTDNQLLTMGAAPKLENYRNWNIKANGISITFDEGTVAPYVFGLQTVTIPFANLKEFINKDSVIGSCVYNPRTCGRQSLLSGGFIDEAKNNKPMQLQTNSELLISL